MFYLYAYPLCFFIIQSFAYLPKRLHYHSVQYSLPREKVIFHLGCVTKVWYVWVFNISLIYIDRDRRNVIRGYKHKFLFLSKLFFRAKESHASLFFAHKSDIRKISLNQHNDIVSIVNNTRSSCAIDYNFRTGMIFWSDVMTQKIYK